MCTTVMSNEENEFPAEYREQFPDVKLLIKRSFHKLCNLNIILNRFPIIKWLPKYEKRMFLDDLVAGVTVGLTAIPQGIAYAEVAGLGTQYGLYSGFIGCFVYFILGSCKDITIGPTAIMALMVQRYVSASPDFAVLSTFLSGIVIFLCGLLNLGFLVQFISIPVTGGFVSAAAITIASGQIKSILGISGKSNEFVEAWKTVIDHIGETRLWDTVLGVTTIIFLLIFRKLKDIKGRYEIMFRYISLSRNALAVIFGTLIAYLCHQNNEDPFILTGNVSPGFPPVKPPPFSTNIGNRTLDFNDMLTTLGPSIITIPLISILESIAVAKAFSKGKIIDATQEMIALGMCNVFGSFFSSMPTTGSFTRTAINNASGVRTPLGGIFTGGLVLIALGFLTQTFFFIPKATLAAVILAAMFFMIEFEMIHEIWKTKKIDLIPFMITMIVCLGWGLEFGILSGVGVNILFLLYNTARPKLIVEHLKLNGYEILHIIPEQNLVFSSAEYMRNKILKLSTKSNSNFIIINGISITSIDISVVKNLKVLSEDLALMNKRIYFWKFNLKSMSCAWRLNVDFGKLFKNFENIEDFVILMNEDTVIMDICS